ncbi:MAG: peptidoglycan-binding protein [Methylocystis sp.]|uniref:peptidoglycan-binding domain-containing protein n=2 Tax=Methylocystis sp. TaxID=1911079 RepID=UPI003920C494
MEKGRLRRRGKLAGTRQAGQITSKHRPIWRLPAKASRPKNEGSIDMRATIKLGDTGDDVKRIQRVFARDKVLGPDDVDGVFGPRTEQAVKDFQQSNGLTVDGIVGPITWSHVHPYREASPTLQAGSTGPVVAKLQGVLKTGFGYSGAIDGIFGPVTEAVVRQYQTNSGLPVTGIMDERTWLAPAGAAGATLESLSGLIL